MLFLGLGLLEVLSLMEKEVAKELASETVTRNKEKTCSREEQRKSAFTESSISHEAN